jgi:Domain of unknown function (DUF4406)
MSLIYIAGPYRGDVEKNVEAARKVAVELWKKGHAVICPHANSYKMDEHGVHDDAFLSGDLIILARCDAIVLLSNWEDSAGARAELDYANKLGIPVYHEHALPDLHPTEVNCPNQAIAYAETVNQMYRLHLSKNADYSPANILGTGEHGVIVRLWDKIARLMNLTGYQFKISESRLEAPKEPKHEAIEDSFIDAACYGVIGLLVRRGVWGR